LFFLSDNFVFGNSLSGCVPKNEQHDVTLWFDGGQRVP
jgi:hypothetical protein